MLPRLLPFLLRRAHIYVLLIGNFLRHSVTLSIIALAVSVGSLPFGMLLRPSWMAIRVSAHVGVSWISATSTVPLICAPVSEVTCTFQVRLPRTGASNSLLFELSQGSRSSLVSLSFWFFWLPLTGLKRSRWCKCHKYPHASI